MPELRLDRRITALKITVVGLGYVGTVAAAALAGAGHDVLGIDIDRSRTELLGTGKAPLYEPGLEERIEAGLRAGTLRFLHRDDAAEVLGEVALIATGTPPTHGGGADLHQVRAAVSWVRSMSLENPVSSAGQALTVVMKSTVPPGTGRRMLESELRGTSIRYASNPEFLREGRAVDDWEKPDRIVIGVEPDDTRSVDTVKRMYKGIDAPCMVTDITSAEMIKYASNAFLATRISFINEIASLCDTVGASIDEVSEGMAMDSRTGARIHAGVGYGGSCFPKDVRALDHLALTSGASVDLLRSVINTNNRQRLLPLHALRQRFGGALDGLRVGILGLAFKPGTDDVRDAPAIDLIRALVDEGAEVQAFDPEAMESARPSLPTSVRLVEGVEAAANRTQALVLLTEWDSIVQSDWRIVSRCMIPPRLVFDGRNALDPVEMNRLGFEYVGVGRGPVRGAVQDGASPWSVTQGLVV
jgi:UDPglucose 6-dehydrogenase